MKRLALALAIFLLPAPTAWSDDAPKQPDLAEALSAFFAEDDAAVRAQAGMALAMRFPDAKAVADALPGARTWPADAEKDDVIQWKRKTDDGVEHTILAFIPAAYDPAQAWPVMIWLHGAVSRPQDGGGVSGVQNFGGLANEEGFIVLSPSAQQGSEWWTPGGVDLVRGSLDDLKARYRVDADRVCVAGFSDGASGCFHLLSHDPEPYACFLPLMAHPGVTRLAGGPSFAVNVRSRPVYAVNGGRDTLYPSAAIKPLIEHVRKAGCDITWLDLPEAGHNPNSVFPEHWPTLRDFWKQHPREALPKTIAWETALPAREGRFAWVEILAVDPKAPSAEGGKDMVLPDPAGRPVLGVRLDLQFPGPGIRIESVSEDSAAVEAGFQAGDVILSVDGVAIENAAQARAVLGTALPAMAESGKAGTFRVRRGEEELDIECLPRVAGAGGVERPADRGYGLPSGRIEAKVVAGNRIEVTTRHVKRFKLHLADGLVDLAQPVTVVVNGALRHQGPVEGSTGYVLTEAVRGGPGAPAFRASLVLEP